MQSNLSAEADLSVEGGVSAECPPNDRSPPSAGIPARPRLSVLLKKSATEWRLISKDDIAPDTSLSDILEWARNALKSGERVEDMTIRFGIEPVRAVATARTGS
jgi:hypothetical protein